jgi:hypothetical protein
VTDAATIAWIFYALRLASETAPADFRSISQVADGLNHAVPTHKEMQLSLKWLTDAGLSERTSRGYVVTASGIGLVDGCAATSARLILRQLTDRIASRIELSPNTSLERTREG